ncbi:MAG: multicopper oxidase domain-containing protein [Acidobacteriia bacterium]|nr:multicopper oxidase domain-containing protein [Terriglobia bacterium]
MTRREWMSRVGAGVTAAALGSGQTQEAPGADARDADITLRIQEVELELDSRHSVKTIGYNGQAPGPLLRVREGRSIAVDVVNDTNADELVHWHGLHIPPEVDGSHEEGTPHVPRHGQRRYEFTPRPAGTRWYHTHAMAGRNLHASTYTGQFGMLIVDSSNEPGAYDLEVPILLHEWDPSFAKDGPMDVEYKYLSINGKMLGGGEPIRVKYGQRVLFRMLNASATEHHQLALAGHRFRVVELDGNVVAEPRTVPVIELGPGERADAIVEMNTPGVWILGEVRDRQRNAGMGIVVEYAERGGAARWLPAVSTWDYRAFGGQAIAPEPDGRIPMVIRQPEGGHHWTINGKSFPKTDPIVVEANKRYRMIFDNQSAEAHPLHLHRHTFEITRFDKQATSGVFKDVVVVPAWKQVEVDLIANNPGLTLFHCHQQFHMDFGFMALMQYSG